MTITYTNDPKVARVVVKIDKRIAGYICKEPDGSGYFYSPVGRKSMRGETFPTIAAVKVSLHD